MRFQMMIDNDETCCSSSSKK